METRRPAGAQPGPWPHREPSAAISGWPIHAGGDGLDRSTGRVGVVTIPGGSVALVCDWLTPSTLRATLMAKALMNMMWSPPALRAMYLEFASPALLDARPPSTSEAAAHPAEPACGNAVAGPRRTSSKRTGRRRPAGGSAGHPPQGRQPAEPGVAGPASASGVRHVGAGGLVPRRADRRGGRVVALALQVLLRSEQRRSCRPRGRPARTGAPRGGRARLGQGVEARRIEGLAGLHHDGSHAGAALVVRHLHAVHVDPPRRRGSRERVGHLLGGTRSRSSAEGVADAVDRSRSSRPRRSAARSPGSRRRRLLEDVARDLLLGGLGPRVPSPRSGRRRSAGD